MEQEMDRDVTPPKDEEKAKQLSADNAQRTAYGDLRGNKTSMFGAALKRVEDFPEDITALELKNWYNYELNDTSPSPISASVDDNRRLWQDLEVERMLDHHPTHEVHCSELPDYHYWPMIQNELNNKSESETLTTFEHRHDATDIPRFFKTGVPKTPLQEQDWYLPLSKDGRFDWRKNLSKNGYTASLFDARGWNNRYHLSINRPMLPMHNAGLRQFAQAPIHFRLMEMPIHQRLLRQMSSSTFDRHFMVFGFYLGFLAATSAGAQHWKELNWDFEIGNCDMAFIQINRKQGGFHGLI